MSASGAGRKGRCLTVCAELGYALGVDVDASRARAAVIDCQNRRRGSVAEELRPGLGEEELSKKLVALGRRALRSGRVPREKLVAVGLSLPGPLDCGAGRVPLERQVSGWSGVGTRAVFEKQLGTPVVAELNARCALLGEMSDRKQQCPGRAMLVLARHGVGLSVSQAAGGNELMGLAGEIGHTVLDPAGPRCVCGHRGCLEALAGGWALLARARRLGIRVSTISGLAEMARGGEERVLNLFVDGARALGIALGSASNLFAPKVIYVRGIYAGLDESVGEAIREAMSGSAMPAMLEELRVDLSDSGEYSAAVGAARGARQRTLIPYLWERVLRAHWRPRGSKGRG